MDDAPDRPAQRKRSRTNIVTVDLGNAGRLHLDEVLFLLNADCPNLEPRTQSYAIRAGIALLWAQLIREAEEERKDG